MHADIMALRSAHVLSSINEAMASKAVGSRAGAFLLITALAEVRTALVHALPKILWHAVIVFGFTMLHELAMSRASAVTGSAVLAATEWDRHYDARTLRCAPVHHAEHSVRAGLQSSDRALPGASCWKVSGGLCRQIAGRAHASSARWAGNHQQHVPVRRKICCAAGVLPATGCCAHICAWSAAMMLR